MPTTRYSAETAGTIIAGASPATRMDGRVYGAKVRKIRASFNLADATFAIGDPLVLGQLPSGAAFAGGTITSSVSLGTSTLSIGPAASAAKYRAAAVHTAVDAPTPFGKASAMAQAPLDTEETIIATIAVANLPAAGTLVFELFYTLSA